MKNVILVYLMLAVGLAQAQQKAVNEPRKLNKVLTLKITGEGGANGAAVAWHPKQKKYYAAMAGNIIYPMQVYDATGKTLSDASVKTMFDVRGFWYNPTAGALQANGYDDFGWTQYVLDEKGIPKETTTLFEEMHQPEEQSVGAFVSKTNSIWFLNYETVELERYNLRTGELDTSVTLLLGAKTKAEAVDGDDVKEDYNENAIVFNGTDIGLLNVANRQIELYSLSSGLMKQALQLPEDAPVNSVLNFSYCNGIYWLFDKGLRVWIGYK